MTSLGKNARVAGILYLLASIVGIVRLIYIPNALFVPGNAAATAGNIAAHEMLFRFGIFSELFAAALWIFVPLALYRLFNGVNQGLAVVMVILGSLMQVPIFFMNAVNDAAALLFAHGGDFLTAFDKPQRDALAMLFLRLHHHGDLANEIFWGIWLLPFGLLVYRSRFLPRLLGVWLIIACFGYLALSFTGLLFPQWENKVFGFAQPTMLGEVVVMLWLIIVGAKEQGLDAAEPLPGS
ncbi:MAG TPA: DUF4386 domain-containing protein [Alloacidobacterium sp.]|nr:DUF4386 domain-containing protein [Alloacidobacterium sp.]